MRASTIITSAIALAMLTAIAPSSFAENKKHHIKRQTQQEISLENYKQLARCSSIYVTTAEFSGMQNPENRDQFKTSLIFAMLFAWASKNKSDYESVFYIIREDRDVIKQKLVSLMRSDMDTRAQISLGSYFESRRSECNPYFVKIEEITRSPSGLSEYKEYFDSETGKRMVKELIEITNEGMVYQALTQTMLQ